MTTVNKPTLKCRKCGHEEKFIETPSSRCSKCLSPDVITFYPNGASIVDFTGYSTREDDVRLINNLRGQLSVKEKEIQNLTKRCDDMASQLGQLQELVTNLRNSSEKLIAEKGQLKLQLDKTEKLVVDLQDTIKTLSQKNTELTEVLSDTTQIDEHVDYPGVFCNFPNRKHCLGIGTLVGVISPDGVEKLTGKIDEIVIGIGQEILYSVRYWSEHDRTYTQDDFYESEVEAISVMGGDDSYIRIQFGVGVTNEQHTQQRAAEDS